MLSGVSNFTDYNAGAAGFTWSSCRWNVIWAEQWLEILCWTTLVRGQVGRGNRHGPLTSKYIQWRILSSISYSVVVFALLPIRPDDDRSIQSKCRQSLFPELQLISENSLSRELRSIHIELNIHMHIYTCCFALILRNTSVYSRTHMWHQVLPVTVKVSNGGQCQDKCAHNSIIRGSFLTIIHKCQVSVHTGDHNCAVRISVYHFLSTQAFDYVHSMEQCFSLPGVWQTCVQNLVQRRISISARSLLPSDQHVNTDSGTGRCNKLKYVIMGVAMGCWATN